MSAPEQKAKAESEPEEPPRKARWLDRAVTALLALAFAVAMAAATPALLQAGGVELPVAAPEAELRGHPGAPPLYAPPNLFDPDGDQDDPPQGMHGQLGLARTALTLHEQPSLTADVSGAVGAGEVVQILRVAGDWVLVYYGGASSHDDDLVVGWAKKSEIAIR